MTPTQSAAFPCVFGMCCCRTLLLAVLLLFVAAPGHAARNPYNEGLTAYRAGNYASAFKNLMPLAQKKDRRAMYLLGVMYEHGQGVARDLPMAAAWYQSSADAGYAPSQYNLGRMYWDGRGVAENRTRAAALLTAAARQGHKEAVDRLARLNLPPVAEAEAKPATPATPAAVTPGKPPAAPAAAPAPAMLPPLNAAAAKSDNAALRAALRRVAIDNDAATRQALPALMGAAARQYWLADAVNDRIVLDDFSAVLRDRPDGVGRVAKMLEGATTAEAQATAGLLADLGVGSPQVANSGAAAGAPAAPGCPGYVSAAKAEFAYAWFYAARCVAATDATQARAWMVAAANAGHAGAQELQGRSCIEPATKNWECAIGWLEAAANSGRVSSMSYLGWALSNQPGADEAAQRAALRWYEAAAGKGDVAAQNNLGSALESGPAALRDPVRARFWYAEAARAGFGPAQYNLARLMIAGTGGPADKPGALEWLRKADAAGVREAKVAIDALNRQ